MAYIIFITVVLTLTDTESTSASPPVPESTQSSVQDSLEMQSVGLVQQFISVTNASKGEFIPVIFFFCFSLSSEVK